MLWDTMLGFRANAPIQLHAQTLPRQIDSWTLNSNILATDNKGYVHVGYLIQSSDNNTTGAGKA
jgi:hypothetical protein